MQPVDDAPPLPPLLARIAERCGVEIALAVARQLGGRRVTIPARRMTPDHVLARTFGQKHGRAIAACLEPGIVTIPRAAAAIRGYEARRLRRTALPV